MSKKNPTPPPEDAEEKALEAKIEKMLDPKQPDASEATTPSTSIKVVSHDDEPDEKESEAEALPTKIEIVSHEDDDHSEEIDVDEVDPKAVDEKANAQEDAKEEATEPTTAPPLEGVKPEEDEEDADSVPEKLEEPEETTTETVPTDNDEKQESSVEDNDEPDLENEAEESDDIEDSTDESSQPEPDLEPESKPTKKEADVVAPAKQSPPPSDESLDQAVDDIARADSDAILKEDDEKLAKAFDDKKPTLGGRIKHFFSAWWHNKKARKATVLVFVLGLIGVGAYPQTRYALLNTAGVRSSSSIRIIDTSTLQPLKNVEVEINGAKGLTDIDGRVSLSNIKLGSTQLQIRKRAFAEINKPLTIGFGSNPLSDQSLQPVGTQYTFQVADFVSDKPLKGVEAISDDASAIANEKGEIKITLDQPSDEFEVTLALNGYREEKILVQADSKDAVSASMVAAKKHAFISRRDGTYDVYAVYADGKDEQLLLKGTGSEREDIALIPHPSQDVVALVSTRSGQRNSDGYLLSTLTVLNMNNSDELKEVAVSERIQVIGWQNERMVFVQIKSGTSAANPERHQLKTHNIAQGTTAELASANYFNDVMAVEGTILFAPSSAYAKTPPALYRINADGSDRQIVFPQEVWSMFRTDYGHISFTTGPEWHEYEISSKFVAKLEGQPANIASRRYVENGTDSAALRVDSRDGKGVLLLENISDQSEQTLVEQSGLKNPLIWLNDSTILYRIKTDTESADFVISTNGGDPKKVTNVEDTAGLERWYYY